MTSAAGNRHRILRQVFELDLAVAQRAPEVQVAVARPFRPASAEELERMLDSLAGPNDMIRIDRLVLDLGELRGADWQGRYLDRLMKKLREALSENQIQQSASELDSLGKAAPREPSRSVQGDGFQQLLFFLANGRLPWWGDDQRLRRALADLAHLTPDRSIRLRALMRADNEACCRLVFTLDDATLQAVTGALGGPPASQRVLQLLAPADPVSASRWRQGFWRLVIERLALESTVGDQLARRGREVMARLLGLLHALDGPETNGTEGAIESARVGSAAGSVASWSSGGTEELSALPEPWRGWLASLDAQRVGAQARAPEARGSAPDQDRAQFPTPVGAQGVLSEDDDQPTSSRTALSVEDSSSKAYADETVYVQDAGAVLLHPFLTELFVGRALVGDADAEGRRPFRTAEARARAVNLLAYMVFGCTDTPEHELLLAKLLCAMPWHEPLIPVESLDRDLVLEDRAAGDELLSAVLRHWKALRSASPEWLREQFLARDGKLESVNDGWRLIVERRAQDILQRRLPWGVGVICLPWMSHRLHVNWSD